MKEKVIDIDTAFDAVTKYEELMDFVGKWDHIFHLTGLDVTVSDRGVVFNT